MLEVSANIGSWYGSNESLIQAILIYALLAFSLQVALRAGAFSVASIGFYGIGSYTTGLLAKEQHWPALPALLAAGALAGLLGWILALLFRGLRDLYLGIATVAFVLMVGVVAVNWVSLTGGSSGVVGIPDSVSTLVLSLTVLVVIALLVLLERGTIGRALVAIREDEELAESFSVDVQRYRSLALVVSSVLGALAGGFHSLIYGSIQPTDASFDLIILVLAMVVVGGYGSWVGALVGATVLTVIPLKLVAIGHWWAIVYGALMIIVGTFARGGILGIASAPLRAARSRRLSSPLWPWWGREDKAAPQSIAGGDRS